MIEYILFFLIYNLAIFITDVKEKKNTIFLLFSILFIFSAFRFNVGVDYPNYKELYETKGDIQALIRVGSRINEIGFIYIIKILNILGAGFQVLLMLYAFITIYFILKFIDIFSINYKLTLIAYAFTPIFYLTSFNAVRQSAAISLFAFSIVYIYERKFWRYSLIILVGTIFCHLSMVLMLPIYFYAKLKLTRSKELIIILSSILVGFIITYLIRLTPYNLYLNDSDFNLNLIVLVFLGFFMFIMWNKKQIIKNEKLNILYNIGFLSSIVLILMFENRNFSANLFLRLNSYFVIVYLVLLGVIPAIFKERNIKIFIQLTIILGIFMMFWQTIVIKGDYYSLVPFSFNFNFSSDN